MTATIGRLHLVVIVYILQPEQRAAYLVSPLKVDSQLLAHFRTLYRYLVQGPPKRRLRSSQKRSAGICLTDLNAAI